MNTIQIITAARSLRRACETRCMNRDDAEAEHDARVALLELARGIEVDVYPARPSRWTGTDAMARNVEAAAELLAEAAHGQWKNAGHVAGLMLHFGALASRLGCDVESWAPNHDDAARAVVEGERMAAE